MSDAPATRPTSRAGRDLPAAIGVGVALFAVLAIGLIWVHWLFIALATVALCLGAIEVARALRLKHMHAETVPIVVGTGLSVLGGYLASVIDLRIEPTTFVVICLAGTLFASLAARLPRGAHGFVRDAAASAFVIAYIPLLGVFIPLLLGSSLGALRMLTVIGCVVAADVGAYAFGVLFGRHKMAPTISPSKTWEGLAGGVITAMAVGVLASVFLLGAPWWVGLPLGLFVSLGAVLGDLVESLIKRDAGLKDMSNFLPGHGGVMDRLDSMLLAVPVGWLILHLALGL
ncbi:phosphatidate cytidylyltransferase [Tessaracoccus flavus]|uniref:Phosphatidate cytidylyltransferase n=1 Tax=Tessaracoccus flavus TaxID=1610493 RepID=A0A1Q2CDJ5_9ACTN|nr:phosphatidate cytidylyltransferase [Tessaracoccus flavus]AQP44167.1 phosphatidate cytidylyltransferase [Tessaracoccus flavus]SDY37117.1 phosphatidate cytidylyltransferase [Tessaracoccus flavus]